jgi:hypothetical protein
MATHAVQIQGHRPWLAAVVTISIVALLAGVGFAAGRNSAPTQTAARGSHSFPSQVRSMMPWVQHHADDIAWMRAHMGTVAWSQRHEAWMRSSMDDVAWMSRHPGQWSWLRSHMAQWRWMRMHPQQWQWMRSHIGDIGWIHDHMGEYDQLRSAMSGRTTGGDHMMGGSQSGGGWHW